jgi:hypothetical protein
MRRFLHPTSATLTRALCRVGVLLFALTTLFANAQRHNGLSSPPTAPPPHPATPAAQPIVAVSTGMGALQFVTVNYGVPAPQSLTRQLQADDDRTRAASLSAIGAPAQYLNRGHIPYPHSIQLDFVALGVTDELDAILTVELDQHIVSAILVPQDDSWHRVATVLEATNFSNPSSTPATFLRVARSLIQHERYRAVYRAVTNSPNGDFTENEAHLRVLNNKAVILVSFASSARACPNTPKKPGCDLTRRWLQPDPSDPTHRFLLITSSGHLSAHEAADPIADAPVYQQAHLRTFACQPYAFSDTTQHYEPTANSGPCPTTPATTPTR